MVERKMPSSIDAEKAVLGSAFLSKLALKKYVMNFHQIVFMQMKMQKYLKLYKN